MRWLCVVVDFPQSGTTLALFTPLTIIHLISQNETLSEKEIKRLGFALSEVRYNELLPLLARLNELEEQQSEEEVSSVCLKFVAVC